MQARLEETSKKMEVKPKESVGSVVLTTTDLLQKIMSYLSKEIIPLHLVNKNLSLSKVLIPSIKRFKTINDAKVVRKKLAEFMLAHDSTDIICCVEEILSNELRRAIVNNNSTLKTLDRFNECKGKYNNDILMELKKPHPIFSSRCKKTLKTGGIGLFFGLGLITLGALIGRAFGEDKPGDDFNSKLSEFCSIMSYIFAMLTLLFTLVYLARSINTLIDGHKAKKLFSSVQNGLTFFETKSETTAREESKSDINNSEVKLEIKAGMG